MKALLALALTFSFIGQSFAGERCHVGFRLKRAQFHQKLNKRNARKLELKTYDFDQFSQDLLTFDAYPKYDRKGRYKKCELKNIRYAGEKFSRFGTAFKKGAVGTGLFVAGLGTFALTVATLAADASSENKQRKSHNVHVIHRTPAPVVTETVVVTYDHLPPYYSRRIVRRRYHRHAHVHYHVHVMDARTYARMQAAYAGIELTAFLLEAAFRIPKSMKNTNLHAPAENYIAEENCHPETIKNELVFDSYLFCGNFEKKVAANYSDNRSQASKVVEKAMGAIRQGKAGKYENTLSSRGATMLTRGPTLYDLRKALVGQPAGRVGNYQVLDGKIPGSGTQTVTLENQLAKFFLSCRQRWAYDEANLSGLDQDFVPYNLYEKCKIDRIALTEAN